MTPTADVAVVGAGPAGSFAAGLLSRTGHDVFLVGPHGSSAPTPVQSLAPAALALLEDEGVDVAGAVARVPIEVRWPSADLSRPSENPASSLLVDRAALDAALRGWAALQGVRMYDAKLESSPQVGADGRGRLRLEHGDVAVGRVLNAAGARSIFAAQRTRVGPPLFGLVASVDAAVEPGIHVEATPSAWIWMAASGDGRMSVLTTHRSPPPRREALSAMLSVLNEATLDTAQVARAAVQAERIRPMDLSAAIASPIPGIQAVGDAAVSVDPIAGQGLAIALRSAAQVADQVSRGVPLVRTASDVSRTHASLAAKYYEEAAAVFPTPFWTTHAAAST